MIAGRSWNAKITPRLGITDVPTGFPSSPNTNVEPTYE